MRTTFRSRSSRARQVPDPGEIDIVGCSNPRIEGEDFVVDVEIRADVADSAIVAVYSPNAQLKGQKVIGPLSVGTQTHTIRFNGAATDLTPLPPGSVPVGISVTWNLFGASPPPTADQACGYAPIDGDNAIQVTSCDNVKVSDPDPTTPGVLIESRLEVVSSTSNVSVGIYIDGEFSGHTPNINVPTGGGTFDYAVGGVDSPQSGGEHTVGFAAAGTGRSLPDSPDVSCGTFNFPAWGGNGGNGGNGTNGGNGGNGGGGGGGGSLPLTTPQIVVAFVVVGAAMWYISNQ